MANNQYYGTVPQIAQAFQNDPRNKLAQSALALGTSVAPVAQGGWAVPDGLARAAQAILGAVVNKKNEKKYATREQEYMAAMQQAAQQASTPQPVNPAVSNPATSNPMTAAASALGGVPGPSPSQSNGPLQQIDPNVGMGMPSPPPQAAPQTNFAPSGPPMPPPPQMGAGGPPSVPMADPISGGTGPKRGAQPVQFINPLGGTGRATDGFGGTRNHNGQDWAAPAGTPIMAAGEGVVIAASTNNRSGNFVRIRHPDGSITGYAHLKEVPALKPGQEVPQGAVIGTVGSTGRSTGNHLHFTVTAPNGTKVNPGKIQYASATAAPATAGATADPLGLPPPPQMEAVPNGPEAPAAQQPGAPARPAEVQGNRLAMAQQMLASGNPDLAMIAQTYLDKGLDEQYNSRTLASQQEFAQGQTGYQAGLNDYNAARSDSRQDAYGQRRDAQQRNFARDERYAGQQFNAGQSNLDRGLARETREDQQQYGTQERLGAQQYGTQERLGAQQFQAGENALNRNNKVDVAQLRQQQRSAYFNSPTGLKMQAQMQEKQNANEEAISKYLRFMDLNDKQGTGGVAQNLPIVGGALNFMDNDLSQMDKIAKDTTLANLGGGLGAQISDGDRKFIESANLGTSNQPQVNRNIAAARIGALRRSNDYIMEFQNAQADGNPQGFAREWSLFAKSAPIVQYDQKGNVVITDKPMTYSQWKASRPKFDATGKQVK